MATNRISAVQTWFSAPPRGPRVAVRLFCLPYAGGGASIFRTWAKDLPPEIHVVPVEYPGHGCRIREPLVRRVPELIGSLADDIGALAADDYAIVGHSMGALLGLELARELRRRGYGNLRHLFACARSAPHIPRQRPDTYDLPDAEFIREIERLDGTPPEVLADRELLEFVLPSVRADFELVETYRYTPAEPLDCGITALGGADDVDVSADDLRAWKQHTRADFRAELVDGGHFFLFNDWNRLCGVFSESLSALAI
jgi:medium-chain acyl-[acyl-carrier-protein] hydrolase